jgi:bud site selection protein 31
MAPRWGKKKPPHGYDYVEPVLEALENELRDRVKESNDGKRKTESLWPVHQINWQRSRYIYDMYYTYKRISRQIYDYCIDEKLVDAALIAKWKKPGYERLCSTYVINPTNYKFGTTSICRVPLFDRSEDQRAAQDPTVRKLMLRLELLGNRTVLNF